jgi:hypothetical protein
MKTTWWFLLVMVLSSAVLGESGNAVAEQKEVKAMAPWEGEGFAFPIGDDRVYMTAVFTGIMFVEDGQGALHAGSLVCPATVEADLKTATKSGKGHCIISNTEGERVYAEFSCTGDLEGCRGPFTITGGTGKFSGITGEGEMISKIQVRQLLVVEGFESARQHGEGIAIWPRITYTIPETP